MSIDFYTFLYSHISRPLVLGSFFTLKTRLICEYILYMALKVLLAHMVVVGEGCGVRTCGICQVSVERFDK